MFCMASKAATILEGDSITVCALQFPVWLHAAPGSTQHVWSNGSTADSTAVYAAGTYWVASNANGILHYDTIVVSEKSMLVETFEADNRYLCLADTPWQVTASRVFSPEGVWNNGQQSILEVAMPGLYWFTSTDTSFCLRQVDTVAINALLQGSVLHLADTQTVCASSFPVDISIRFGDNPIWQDSSTDYSLLVDTAGSYAYQSFIGTCTQVFDTIKVQEKVLVAPTLCCDTVVCFPDSVGLSLPAGFVDYYWSTGQNSATVFIGKVGVFQIDVTVTDHTACSVVTNSIQVEVKDSIPKPTIIENGKFLVASPIGYSFQWYRNDSLLPLETTSVLPYNQEGKYCVVISNGICEDSACVLFTSPTSLHENQTVSVSVFPNPAKRFIVVKGVYSAANFSLLDICGRVKKVPILVGGAGKYQLDVLNIEPGMYFLNIDLPETSITQKVIIQH